MQPAQIQQLLQQGGAALQQRNFAGAAHYCTTILSQFPNEPNALHLLGLARKGERKFDLAQDAFQRAVAAQPANPEMRNNFGNLLRDMGQYDAAVSEYQTAIKHRHNFADPWFNLGLTQQAMGNHTGAIDSFQKASNIKPNDPRFQNSLGISLKELERLDEAAEAYSQALKLAPNHYRALHNLGVVYRMQNKQADAVDCFKKALAIEPRVAELRYNMANALYELGQIEEADEEYRKVIGLKPDYLEAHETLNQLYWEHGKRDLFGKSYQIGIQAAPQSAELREAHVKALELSGQAEAAEETTDKALAEVGDHAGLLRRKARLRATAGDNEAAQHFFQKAVEQAPNTQPIRMDFARFLIQVNQCDAALPHLDAAETLNPHDQQMWAYRGLCWRLLGDKRESWLNDYDTFVEPQLIETPSGYASLSAFLEELSETVDGLHVTEVRPLEQTLRGGTQTHGKLFFRPEPIIQKLRAALEQSVASYLAKLPEDPDHPFLRRKSSSFRFAGSWSVKLTSGGFHVNHIHPAGWISSSFYVDVPSSVDGGNQAGWIKFGESGLSLGADREIITKTIKPEPGLLALFPSYIWHGTVPFEDKETRLTTPFDVVPA